MSAAVTVCPDGPCYHNQVQARAAKDSTRQDYQRRKLPAWLWPTGYARAACGRWHLTPIRKVTRRPPPHHPAVLALTTAA